MQQEFDKEIFGQRRQVETVFSIIKRNQGEALLSKSYLAQNRKMMLKVLIHNIAIILLVNELFYRAYLTPLTLLDGANLQENHERRNLILCLRHNRSP